MLLNVLMLLGKVDTFANIYVLFCFGNEVSLITSFYRRIHGFKSNIAVFQPCQKYVNRSNFVEHHIKIKQHVKEVILSTKFITKFLNI